jgi:putative transposase
MFIVPKPFPREFREDVIRVARNREPGVRIKDVAADFGISESCLQNWLTQADRDDGVRSGATTGEQAELRGARKRIRLLEQETRCRAGRRHICPRRSCRGNDVPARPRPCRRRDPRHGDVPVVKIARQPYYRWLECPVSDAELDEAWLANAIVDAYRDDPEFGYRFLADEVRAGGFEVSDRVVWRICRDMGWWSVFGKPKARKAAKPGTPAHDDLVRRRFTADAPNEPWVADLTEHRTAEGKVYLCAIKDLFSNRIVGWAIDERMKARLVVAAIEMAVARRDGDVAGCIFHTDRGPVSVAPGSTRPLPATAWSAPWAKSAPPATAPPWNRSSRCCNATCWTGADGPPATSSASRASPGSNAPTTDAADKPPSAASPRSNTRPS